MNLSVTGSHVMDCRPSHVTSVRRQHCIVGRAVARGRLAPSMPPVGRVRLSERARLGGVRGDELLLSVRDSLDVQSVQVWRVVR